MLNGRFTLADVGDVEGFVHATIRKLNLVLTPDEWDELIADGLEIMLILHRDYRPGKGTFSGYATSLLRGRLLDRHHQHHRGEHIKTRDSAGRAMWEYRAPIASLNAALEHPTFDESRVTTIHGFHHTRVPRPRRPACATVKAFVQMSLFDVLRDTTTCTATKN